MPKLKFRIKPNGQVAIDADGFRGEACREATKTFIERLGVVSDEKPKPEMYENASVQDEISRSA